MAFTLSGDRVLLADGTLQPATLAIEGGLIVEVRPGRAPGADLDAGARPVLPGIVDLHGDAFERQVMPRPTVRFPLDLALLETDRQMIANGITTAFHGVTCSWEPGLRSHTRFGEVGDAIARLGDRLAVDTRVHLRLEVSCLDAEPAVTAALAAGGIGLLAFNDHLAEIIDDLEAAGVDAADYASRAGVDATELLGIARAVADRSAEFSAALTRLAAAAAAAGVAMASHDDPDPETRHRYHKLGCRIAEFPVTPDTVAATVDLGDPIVMGAPNVLHGGSHKRILAAADLVRQGTCDALVSDYYYPSLLLAPFRLADGLGLDLAAAWHLVAAGPAEAAGLTDRGRLSAGRRADVLIVEDRAALPALAAAWVAGRPVYAGPDGADLPRAA